MPFYRTCYACENTLRFLHARRTYERDGNMDALATMQEIARLERDMYLCKRLDGKYAPCIAMIEEKVRWIEE